MPTVPLLLRAGARAVARLVAPARCAACDTPLAEDALFCGVCEPRAEEAGRVDWLESGVRVVSTGLYAGALARAVRALKYRQRPDLARPLGERLARVLRGEELGALPLLVPVPLHPTRLAERGYNQAALLADVAARRLGLSSKPRALCRTRQTSEQASLGRHSRLENVRSAFSVKEEVGGRAVVVVDDVVTTGATALGCAAALTRAGAMVVGIAALARADRADAGLSDAPASLSGEGERR